MAEHTETNEREVEDGGFIGGTVTVACGASAETIGLLQGDRLTVGDLRKNLAQTINIPNGAQALLNGQPASDNVVVGAEDRLEFVREARVKG